MEKLIYISEIMIAITVVIFCIARLLHNYNLAQRRHTH